MVVTMDIVFATGGVLTGGYDNGGEYGDDW